ncbi:hypothetical protein RB49ORF059c [Escherichia phage RB49]|uniref:Uncharacterized protein n=1 Tax=Escherichia phage RB49 TaxID=50948 RepID=Q7Y3S1_BPRB4|nr:goF mRNA metabolism modulator [Escherichia phage RB49]AAQ15333.1 hypothetical protein RB49ORF059c [Escherichia phage RB49]
MVQKTYKLYPAKSSTDAVFERGRYYTFRNAESAEEFVKRYPQHNKFLYGVLHKGFKVLTVNVMGKVYLVETHDYEGASIMIDVSERKYFKRITKKQFEEMKPVKKEESLEDLINLFGKVRSISFAIEDDITDNKIFIKNAEDLKEFLIENRSRLETFLESEIIRHDTYAKFSADKVAELKEIQKSFNA